MIEDGKLIFTFVTGLKKIVLAKLCFFFIRYKSESYIKIPRFYCLYKGE